MNMKKVIGKLATNQSGQSALAIVLILLLLCGLVIGPLLAFMGTGLKAGQMHEEKTEGYYAADAGIEDAMRMPYGKSNIHGMALFPRILPRFIPQVILM
jgi:hypothetical protein